MKTWRTFVTFLAPVAEDLLLFCSSQIVLDLRLSTDCMGAHWVSHCEGTAPEAQCSAEVIKVIQVEGIATPEYSVTTILEAFISRVYGCVYGRQHI